MAGGRDREASAAHPSAPPWPGVPASSRGTSELHAVKVFPVRMAAVGCIGRAHDHLLPQPPELLETPSPQPFFRATVPRGLPLPPPAHQGSLSGVHPWGEGPEPLPNHLAFWPFLARGSKEVCFRWDAKDGRCRLVRQ